MMKLNKFGINIDEGLPLAKDSINKLYEPCFEEQLSEIKEWINNETNYQPLLLGGQIGSGKSTLLNKLFLEKKNRPFISIEFDKESLNLDEGDFLGILLSAFLKKAKELKTDLSSMNIPYDYFELDENDSLTLADTLVPNVFTLESYDKKNIARKKITEKVEFFIELILKIGKELIKSCENQYFIFASGIDKFNAKSSAYLSSIKTLEILAQFKTLFEVNAIHLFLSDRISPFGKNSQKLMVSAVENDKITKILKKRMGIYSQSINNELDIIAEWSGGNPRQAIRILSHYLSFKKKNQYSKAEKLIKAIKKTTDDFFAFATKPSAEIIRSVDKEKSIETSLINLPGDKETAQEAIFGNWIFITENSVNGKWPASVNPLVKPFFESLKIIVGSPENKMLKKFADSHGISASGLTFTTVREDGTQKTPDELLFEYLSSGIEEPYPLKLSEILDLISAALLSKDRKDRIIIAYKDKAILEAARAYIFAKANSYEYQRYLHSNLDGGKGKEPIKQLENILQNDTDIFSLDFKGEWTESQLDILNKHRDKILNYQMIWWIQYDMVRKYLPHWVQLRELFEFYVLEDEMLGSLTQEDIQADISFFEDLAENTKSAESELVKNLKIVLEFLRKGGKNG